VYQATGSCSISGEVYYYRDASGPGTEPSAKPVPNIGIDSTGDSNPETSTDPNGLYALGGLMGDVTVKTVQKLGAARAADNNEAVTSFDALLIARSSIQLITLSGKQQIAGDASGNGTVSAYDAALVSQFTTQVLNHLPVATLKGSDWQFLRCDGYPACTNPAFSYTPLTGPETANFYAILYGDVSGNWQKASSLVSTAAKVRPIPEEAEAAAKDRVIAARLVGKPLPGAYRRSGAASIYLEGAAGPAGRSTQRTFYVLADNVVGIQGLDLTLDYDPARLAIVEVQAVDQDSGFSAIWHDTPGSLQIAFYGYAPLETAGRLVKITVESRGRGPIVAPKLSGAHANEGSIPTRIVPSLKGVPPREKAVDPAGTLSFGTAAPSKAPGRGARQK
jgi:hypothetical protein